MSALERLPPGGGRVRAQAGEGWVELVLDQPGRRNAITPGMMVQLRAHVDALQAAPPAGVLLLGEGGQAFCAGGDLGSVRAHLLEPAAAAAMNTWMTETLDGLAALPCPVVAAVEGVAIGGGAEILSACDLIFAAEDARVGFVQARVGVSPGWGGGARLVSRVGMQRAVQVLASARAYSAKDAARIGLVDEVLASGEAAAGARRWLAGVARLPRAALHAVVQAARTPALEREIFLGVWGGPEHRAALTRLPGGSR